MESATFRKWLAEHGCRFDTETRSSVVQAMRTCHLSARFASHPEDIEISAGFPTLGVVRDSRDGGRSTGAESEPVDTRASHFIGAARLRKVPASSSALATRSWLYA
jgi:hypothetical protein